MASEKFPEKNEFRIHSHPLFILGDEDGDSEMLVFDANMVIRTGEPKVGLAAEAKAPTGLGGLTQGHFSPLAVPQCPGFREDRMRTD